MTGNCIKECFMSTLSWWGPSYTPISGQSGGHGGHCPKISRHLWFSFCLSVLKGCILSKVTILDTCNIIENFSIAKWSKTLLKYFKEAILSHYYYGPVGHLECHKSSKRSVQPLPPYYRSCSRRPVSCSIKEPGLSCQWNTKWSKNDLCNLYNTQLRLWDN